MPLATPALGAARTLLVILRLLNGMAGAALVIALIGSFVLGAAAREFITVHPPLDPRLVIPSFRAWTALMLPIIVAVHLMLSWLLAIVDTVAAGNAFASENAARLTAIAWCLLAVQLLSLALGILAELFLVAGGNFAWTFSITGWVAVLLLFVLARVFKEGTRMRNELGSII